MPGVPVLGMVYALLVAAGFIAHVFGPGAAYTCSTGVGACSFFFTYQANGQGLKFHHWINASSDLGGNRGDIATS